MSGNLDLDGLIENLERLKRRYTPAVLDDIERHPFNVGSSEVRELVRLARAALEEREGLLREIEGIFDLYEDDGGTERIDCISPLRADVYPAIRMMLAAREAGEAE